MDFSQYFCRNQNAREVRIRMNQLLGNVLDAHGGMDRWNNYQKLEAKIMTRGGFFAFKGMLQDAAPRRMSAWLHEEPSSVLPYGAPD